MSEPLARCPFCGSKAVMASLVDGYRRIRCTLKTGLCPGMSSTVFDDEPSAITAWNRRTPAPSPSRMREALEEAIRQFKILRAQHLPGSQLYQEEGLTTNVYLNAADTGLAVSRAALSAPEQAGVCDHHARLMPNGKETCSECRPASAPVADEGSEDAKHALSWFDGVNPCTIGHRAYTKGCDDCSGIVLAAEVRRLQAELADATTCEFDATCEGRDGGKHAGPMTCRSCTIRHLQDLAQARKDLESVKADNARLRGFHEECVKALKVFKRYGQHRKSCVQMTGKQCPCGFDDAATKAGALTATKEGAWHGEEDHGGGNEGIR